LYGIRGSSDYEGLIGDPSIDAIYIALPNALHAEWSLKALLAGKHVLCEKPLTSNADEARRLVEAARSIDRAFVEAFHWRYHPLAARMTEIAASGILGPLRHVMVRFRYPKSALKKNDIRLDYTLGGGVLMDAGCYCVNLMRVLLGEPLGLRKASAVLAAPQVDIAMEATLDFPGNVSGSLIVASDLMEETFDIECVLVGERGKATVQNPFLPQLGSEIAFDVEGRRSVETVDLTPTYDFQAAHFVQVVRGQAETLTPASDAVANMAVIDLIYEGAGLLPRGLRAP
jgi:predicted dehydrogenase